jgi:cellulose synthase/poly-beta-1,6-N-acetylglucosamine synthase-like glycosyltransferase
MRNEQDYISPCLVSLLAQDYPRELIEILVLDGESTDRSPEIVADYARQHREVRLLPNPARLQAAAMNLGTREACGDMIIRADAHAVYGATYVSTCVRHLQSGEAENVGGLQRAEGTTSFTRALAAALQSRLGAGNAPYRVAQAPQYADTVWLGAWRRQTLLDLGGFDETLAANEDYELNCRLRAGGGRILLDPALPSTYYPRTSLGRLWRQYFRYGTAKVRVLQHHPNTLVLRQLLPPLFVLALLISAAFIPITPWPFIGVAGLYLLAVLAGSVQTAARAGWAALPFLPLIYPTLHLAWGIGFLYGVLRYGPFRVDLRGMAASERLLREGTVEQPAPRE